MNKLEDFAKRLGLITACLGLIVLTLKVIAIITSAKGINTIQPHAIKIIKKIRIVINNTVKVIIVNNSFHNSVCILREI